VRAALGAGRERLARQLTTQSVVLTLLGGAVGLLIAVLTVPLFSTLVPPTLPVATQPGLDLRVLTVAAAFTSLTALGFGVVPALRAGHAGFAALREGSRAGGGRKQHLRAVLVTVEVTVSVVLLITSGLLIRAVWRVQAVDPGFQTRGVLAMRTALPRPKYDSPVTRTGFYDRVLTHVRALPGVQSAAFTSGLPIVVQGLITGVEIPGQDVRSARSAGVSHRWVTTQYFKTMDIPIRRGRDVEDADTRDRAWVAVVSASFGEHLDLRAPGRGVASPFCSLASASTGCWRTRSRSDRRRLACVSRWARSPRARRPSGGRPRSADRDRPRGRSGGPRT
jgi:hypothetical protein